MKKVLNKNIFLFIRNSIRRNTKGFSLIGVLVSASIGLIVVAGLVQLFINMSSQIKQVENRAGLRTFKTFMERALQDEEGCYQTLNPHVGVMWDNNSGESGEEFYFNEIKNAAGHTVVSVNPLTPELEVEYGLKGSVAFRARCVSSPCPDCSDASNFSPNCEKDWEISLVSQSVVRGTTIFNRPQLLANVSVSFTDPDNFTVWKCGGVSLGSILPPALNCLTLDSVGGRERSLVGCGTTQDATTDTVTSFGFNAGGKGAGKGNTFLGYSTGPVTTTEGNTFVGYAAGRLNTAGKDNTFVGYEAGRSNTKGNHNSFFGRVAGRNNNEGEYNSFFGRESGLYNKTGNGNSYFGAESGELNEAGSFNSFFGSHSGHDNKGSGNSFFGTGAGFNNVTGKNNIYIGYKAAVDPAYKALSNRFVVGSDTNVDWLVGEIGTNTFTVNGNQACLSDDTNCDFRDWVVGGVRICRSDGTNCPAVPSSRAVKKKIKPFKKFQKALEDILKTPLFTYRYKKDPLEKDRMGLISEELPDHLQIKEKGKHSRPDWLSVYGTLWAGIKALHERLEEWRQELASHITKISKTFSEDLKQFQHKVFSRFQALEETLNQMQNRIEELFKQFTQFQTNFSFRLDKAEGKLDLNGKALSEVKENLKQNYKSLSEFKKELAETKQKLADTQSSLSQKHKEWNESHRLLLEENQKLRRELSSLKERIKNIQKESGNELKK